MLHIESSTLSLQCHHACGECVDNSQNAKTIDNSQNANALQRQGTRLYMQHLIYFFRSVCKLISQWICSQNQPICQPTLLSNAICHQLKSQCFCMCIVGFFCFKDNVNEWVILLATKQALLMSPKE